MQALRTLLDRVVMTVCVVLFIEMTIVGTYQIVTRYFFNSPSTFSEEVVTYSFTWLSILAAAYVFGKRGHLAMTFLSAKFTGKPRIWLDIFSEVLVFITALFLLAIGGYDIASENATQVTSALGLPMSLVYAVLPISGVIIMIYSLLNLAGMFKALGSDQASQYGAAKDED
ncbi:MAG: TRAP transporter small permease [Succinivibrio sp.]